MRDVLRNLLTYGDLSFRDFVELALYHPEFGYYATAANPVGKGADYVTAPLLSPVFSFAIGRLVREFLRRCEGEVCSVVDIGSGDGSLIRALAAENGESARFFGVDRAPLAPLRGERVPPHPVFGHLLPRRAGEKAFVEFVTTLDQVPRDGVHFIISNELYDAFPFARLVQRGEHVHELWVTECDGVLDWSEREAPPPYDDYFASHGIELADGQFADVALEWEAFHDDVLRFVERGLIVTIDYGFPAHKLFDRRIRRFGTAAAYREQRVMRDLLADPGAQDLTAHINFSDLERAGERHGAPTLFFDRLAKFLLAIGITEHELFRPLEVEDRPSCLSPPGEGDDQEGQAGLPVLHLGDERDGQAGVPVLHLGDERDGQAGVPVLHWLDARDEARRLVLPDGIGEDLRVLVQGKGVPAGGWSFQKRLF